MAPAQAWRSSLLWIGISSCVIWCMLYWYGSIASAQDPTSFFFDSKTAYSRSYSLEREKLAYEFIATHNGTDNNTQQKSVAVPELCIGIATVGRDLESHEQYVQGAVGSLLQPLSAAERARINLQVLVAHTDPKSHPAYNEPWLAALSDRRLTYDVSNDDMNMLRSFEEHQQPRNKSMYDYGYLLRSCLETDAPWIAILEDDIIAREDWYTSTLAALAKIQHSPKGNWLYLRMFYTESLLGWNGEEWRSYAGWSFVIFVLVTGTLLALRMRSPMLRRHLQNTDIALISCCCLPAFIVLYFMSGRISMQPAKQGVWPMPKFGCCSQGFVYPRAIVPRVIDRVHRAMTEDYYIDMLLERFADLEGLQRFVQVPSLLQHVGTRSSKGIGYDGDASVIWNFGFEHGPR